MWTLILAFLATLQGLVNAYPGCTSMPVIYNNNPTIMGIKQHMHDMQSSVASISVSYCAANENLTNYNCQTATLNIQNPAALPPPVGDMGFFTFTVFDSLCGQFSSQTYFHPKPYPPIQSGSGPNLPSTLTYMSSAQIKINFCLPQMSAQFTPRVIWNTPYYGSLEAMPMGVTTRGSTSVWRLQDSPHGCSCSSMYGHLAYNPSICWASVLSFSHVYSSYAGTYSFTAMNSVAPALSYTWNIAVVQPGSTSQPITLPPPVTTPPPPPPSTSTSTTMMPTTTVSQCTAATAGKVDIAVLVDDSAPTKASAFSAVPSPFCVCISFFNLLVILEEKSVVMSLLTSGISVGVDGLQFGLVTYDTLAAPWFFFNSYTTVSGLQSAVTGVSGRYLGQGANVTAGLVSARTQLAAAGNGLRPPDQHVAIIMLYGASTSQTTDAMQAADLVNKGFRVYGVGLTPAASQSLYQVVGLGNQNRVLISSNAASIVSFLNRAICGAI